MDTNGHNMTIMDRNIRKKNYRETQKLTCYKLKMGVIFRASGSWQSHNLRRFFFDVQKYHRSDRYGQERTEMNWNGQEWAEMDRNGQKRAEIDRNGQK